MNYIDGSTNVFTNTLSRIPRLDDIEAYDCENIIPCTHLCYTLDHVIPDVEPPFALDLVKIAKDQMKDQFCVPIIHAPSQDAKLNFSYSLISQSNQTSISRTKENKIVVPLSLRKQIIQFYHEELCHPGFTRTLQTISNNFWWPSLRADVECLTSTCDTCARLRACLFIKNFTRVFEFSRLCRAFES